MCELLKVMAVLLGYSFAFADIKSWIPIFLGWPILIFPEILSINCFSESSIILISSTK